MRVAGYVIASVAPFVKPSLCLEFAIRPAGYAARAEDFGNGGTRYTEDMCGLRDGQMEESVAGIVGEWFVARHGWKVLVDAC